MGKIIRLYDRSRVVQDWKCEFSRYLAYEYEGKGLTSSNLSLELFLGTTLHDGLAAIATRWRDHGVVDIDEVATTAAQSVYVTLQEAMRGEDEGETENYSREQSSLVEGLLRGFYAHVWPSLITTYPIIKAVEQEMLYTHDGLGFMSKPDLVLGDPEGQNFYIEYKSTSSKREDWINSWTTAVQLHSTIRAIEAHLGEKVTGVVVQGLYKGFQNYGKQSSVFCYGYFRHGNPPFSYPETIYEYRSGFKRVPTWEMSGGVRDWVGNMPPNVLTDQFPQTPPIFINDQLIDNFFAQRAVREHEIKLALQMMATTPEARQEILNTSFPQKFSECNPGWGKPCGFRHICHGGVENPLTQGFQWREPHHAPEAAQWAAAESSL